MFCRQAVQNLIRRCVLCRLIWFCNDKIKGFGVVSFQFRSNFKSTFGEPDQTPCSVASDLVLHCLQMPHEKDARLKSVNQLLN